MKSEKNLARIAGVLFIIATGAGLLSAIFMGGILEASDVLAQVSANETQVLIGTLFILFWLLPVLVLQFRCIQS